MPDTQMATYLSQLRDLQDEILAELERLDRARAQV